jgi:hypothetical protein
VWRVPRASAAVPNRPLKTAAPARLNDHRVTLTSRTGATPQELKSTLDRSPEPALSHIHSPQRVTLQGLRPDRGHCVSRSPGCSEQRATVVAPEAWRQNRASVLEHRAKSFAVLQRPSNYGATARSTRFPTGS